MSIFIYSKNNLSIQSPHLKTISKNNMEISLSKFQYFKAMYFVTI